MKKILVLLMLMVITFGLTACGGDENAAQAPADQVKEQQALADADYDQLTELLQLISAHENIQQQIASLTEQVKNGAVEESALLEATKQLSDDSQTMLGAIKNAQWKTEYYKEHLVLLTAAVDALAQGEKAVYEAGAENDESKLEPVPGLMSEYNAKLDELLTKMGV